MSNSSLAMDKKMLWDDVLLQTMPRDSIVLQFLIGKLDLDYLSENYTKGETEKCIAALIEALLGTSIPRVKSLLSTVHLSSEVSAANIPQFSNFATAVIYLPELLLASQTQLTHIEMGYSLFSASKSDGAAEKYGQNHGNLAMQLGLASVTKKGRKTAYGPTPLTMQYCQLEQAEKMELLQRLCYRVPIIQVAAVSETPTHIVDEYLQKNLAKTTYRRRKSNVLEVLAFALGE